MLASRGCLSRENNSCRAIIVHPGFPLKPADPPRRGNWNELPLELLLIAAGNLLGPDLARLACVNKACRQVAGTPCLWEAQFLLKFGPPGNVAQPDSVCWQELYRYNVSILYDVLYRQRPMELLSNVSDGVIQVVNIPVPA